MTKQTELEILDETISKLGPSSYLGPWLSEVRAEVKLQIGSDIQPMQTLAETKLLCDRQIAECQDKLRLLTEEAQRSVNVSEAKALNILDNAASALRDALRRLTD